MATELEFKKTRGRPRSTSDERAAPVQALDRAMRLLKNLAEHDEATLTELALRTGVPAPTAHRLLMTLQHHDVVDFDETTQHWTIGLECFRMGSSFVRRANVVQDGRPVMRELMEATGETANMAVADQGDVVFVSQVETHEAIRAFFRPGTRGFMHASGIGKALLSYMPRDEVERILERKGLPAFTDKTLTAPADLFADLDATRKRGWSIDDEERNLGMRCLASPIFNQFGEAVAGISISGPTVRLTDEKLGEYGPMVKRAAQKLTKGIGGTQPQTNAP